MTRIFAVILLGLAFGLWATAAAADDAATSPAAQTDHGVPYLNGGIGEDERMQMLAHAKDFNLKLVFAERAGAYLADIGVVIVDAKGQPVLEIKSGGPLLMARLPAGSYKVKATFDGQAQQKTVDVSVKSHAELNFIW